MSHHRPGRSRLARRLGVHGLRRLHLCLQAVGIVQHGVVEAQRRIEKTTVPANHSPAISAVLLLGLMSAPAVALRTTLILAMRKAIHTRKHATRERPRIQPRSTPIRFSGRPTGRRTARGELAQHDHRSRAGRSSCLGGRTGYLPVAVDVVGAGWRAGATEAEAAPDPETAPAPLPQGPPYPHPGRLQAPPMTAAGDESDRPKPQCERRCRRTDSAGRSAGAACRPGSAPRAAPDLWW
jgi:hypothetical protein